MFAYLITDGRYGADSPESFETRLVSVLEQHRPDYALYRDKTNPEYVRYAERFLFVCERYDFVKCLLHGDIALAAQLGAYGVHLTSKQMDQAGEAKAADLFTVVSTHTLDAIVSAREKGADAVTYSPIFPSPGKGEPKGLDALKEAVNTAGIPVIALGGIVTAEQIEAARQTGAAGFASIRYFST